ncbi:uncharacterized membrane protein YhaH (DUF805 family) [Curtobacterium flaccumfaciens]|uniref:Uncharacterized membrane protein YhaH (DUF805 family) n=1 Tax=Curtobacterium salicis TaxID=1779862 RepID=A0ABX0TDQ2_9MICO|nr:hypothetical protein [Curtobacterium sp. WW7]NII42576.1 uncharacterized membrane protein YhaH (DUF805 family) [Curtobacterium sp. WW7]
MSRPEGAPNKGSWRRTRRWFIVAIVFGVLALLFAILGLVGTSSVGNLVPVVGWAIFVVGFSLAVRLEDRRRR